MAIYIYMNADGTLHSYCPNDTDPVASDAVLAAQGMTALKGQPPLDATHQWDPPSKSVITVAALKSIPIVLDFWKRFTSTEREALNNLYQTGTQAQKNKMGAFLQYINASGTVDCNDAYIQSSVNLLETSGVIGVGRAAQILV
jgi:hypothetical protein